MTSTSHAQITEFNAKAWVFRAEALIFGGLGGFSAIMGPLYLFQVLSDAHGKPRPEAGLPLIIMSVPFLGLFALAMFNLWTRRTPLIYIFREGLILRQIGARSSTWLDYIPLHLARIFATVAWSIVSGRAFRQATLVVPWDGLHAVFIHVTLARKTLNLSGAFYEPRGNDAPVVANVSVFGDFEFVDQLEQIVDSINHFRDNIDARKILRSWTEYREENSQ